MKWQIAVPLAHARASRCDIVQAVAMVSKYELPFLPSSHCANLATAETTVSASGPDGRSRLAHFIEGVWPRRCSPDYVGAQKAHEVRNEPSCESQVSLPPIDSVAVPVPAQTSSDLSRATGQAAV